MSYCSECSAIAQEEIRRSLEKFYLLTSPGSHFEKAELLEEKVLLFLFSTIMTHETRLKLVFLFVISWISLVSKVNFISSYRLYTGRFQMSLSRRAA